MSRIDNLLELAKKQGLKVPESLPVFKMPRAKENLNGMLAELLKRNGQTAEWISEYDEIVNWLSDNEGRGLFMYGDCGRGKTLIGRYIIPMLFLAHYRKVMTVYDVQSMNNNLDEVLTKKIVSLDDIGTEEISNTYGNKRLAFAEIMDNAEKNNNLIVVSTNLTIDEIDTKYGYRVLDRIISTTKRVEFKGQSLRK